MFAFIVLKINLFDDKPYAYIKKQIQNIYKI